MKHEKGILLLLAVYSILEFMGAISFDSMYAPLLLARTGNNELVVGIVSAFMAGGCIAASIVISIIKIVGTGHGAGIGLIFVFAGLAGIVMLSILCKNKTIKAMDT